MAPDDDPKDVKVKDLDLARWFQLPSFDQLGEAAAGEQEDARVAEVRERRARVCAEGDPALLESIPIRTQVKTDQLIRFEVPIRSYMSDAPMAPFDSDLVERGHLI